MFLPFYFTLVVISSIRIKYPNSHVKVSFHMNQRLPFCGVLPLMTHLLYTQLFSDMHKETELYKSTRYSCPRTMGTPFTHVMKPGAGKKETEHRKVQIWNDGFPFWELSQVLSSFLLSMLPDMERGKVKNNLLQGFSSSPGQSGQLSFRSLILKWHNEKC